MASSEKTAVAHSSVNGDHHKAPPPFNPPRPIPSVVQPKETGTGKQEDEEEEGEEEDGALSEYAIDGACYLPGTRCKDWCCACLCISCMAYQHRIDVLEPQWKTKYRCCQDLYSQLHPACTFCGPCAPHAPLLCLCLESFCCAGLAVAGSRFHINRTQRIKDRPFEAFTGNILCCLEMLGFLPIACSSLSRCVSACLLVQQDVEIRLRGIESNLHLDARLPPGTISSRKRRPTEAAPLLSKT
ncbi:MAG: hypothetical protein Q8P67_04850 [archaeon]|nr:hypothetical protein [archaeon]